MIFKKKKVRPDRNLDLFRANIMSVVPPKFKAYALLFIPLNAGYVALVTRCSGAPSLFADAKLSPTAFSLKRYEKRLPFQRF